MRYILNILIFFIPPTRFFNLKRTLANCVGLRFEEGVAICGQTCFFGKGLLVIGKNTWVGINNSFYCSQFAEIRIGANCDIGPEVSFVAGSHEIGGKGRRAGQGTGSNIVVEDGCWIGARVTILGGVTVSSGAIVGAGSLVNKDIPSNVIYAGVPAVFIRSLNDE